MLETYFQTYSMVESTLGTLPILFLIMGWDDLLIMLAMAALQMALAPKPPKPKPATLQDLEAPVAEAGRPIPVTFGTVLIKGSNVVWYGDLKTVPVKTKSGKKG